MIASAWTRTSTNLGASGSRSRFGPLTGPYPLYMTREIIEAQQSELPMTHRGLSIRDSQSGKLITFKLNDTSLVIRRIGKTTPISRGM